jgi:hypothetical protein
MVVELDGEVMELRAACMQCLGLTLGQYNRVHRLVKGGTDISQVMALYQVDPSHIKMFSLPADRQYKLFS